MMNAAWIVVFGFFAVFFFAGSEIRAQDASPLSGQPVIDLAIGQGRILRFDKPVESVLIADTEIADLQVVSPEMIYVFGLKPGLTNLIVVTTDQRVETTARFRVTLDLTPAKEARRRLQPKSTVKLTTLDNRIVATGPTRNVEEAIDIDNIASAYSPAEEPPINKTTVHGSQQVNIRVRFAEVSRTELQSYGVDWSAGVSTGGFEFGVMQNNGIPDSSGGNLGFSLGSKALNLEVVIEALKRNGIVKILAEPNLTALTGQTASFLAGGEIPVPIPQGNDVVTIQYKPFGVSLGFTPTVLGRNRIGLHVQPEVSSLSESGSVRVNGFSLPSFITRKADTTVEVASGQTFAIAGLFQQRMSRNLEKFPVLGDVPVLGALFQSQRFQKEETELVILITPYLVEPVNGELAAPLDRPTKRKHAKDPAAMGLIIK